MNKLYIVLLEEIVKTCQIKELAEEIAMLCETINNADESGLPQQAIDTFMERRRELIATLYAVSKNPVIKPQQDVEPSN